MNLPHSFLETLDQVPGLDDPQQLIQALDTVSPTSIRINPTKLKASPTQLASVQWSQFGYYLSSRPSFVADPLFHAGVYYVQEASSMVIGTVVRSLLASYFEEQPVRVLDLCAAPGGKSTDIISNLRPQDLLLSNEVVKSRAQILKENVIKWGYPNHLVSSSDPREFKRIPAYFDIVVVDAPCSGEGMFRKDHGAREEWSEEHVGLCSARQERILFDIWDSLAENGFLIYSTCTFNTAENERILESLVTSFDAEPMMLEIDDLPSDGPVYRFFPHHVKGEGFTFFIVQKRSAEPEVRLPKVKTKQVNGLPISANVDGRIVQEGDRYLFYTHDQDAELLDKHLRLIRKGVSLGTSKKNKWVPDPELAFSSAIDTDFPEVPLSLELAQTYLKCDPLVVPSASKGFHKVSFHGQGLGFVNHLGNRTNNYFPSNWRIRTQQPLSYTDILL